jgi:isopropylmalate/homocitrate/citramalate synthase
MDIPAHVRIVEVAPRDGLQNEAQALPVNVRVRFIEELVQAGLKTVECGSFVSAKWVPQMADTSAVLRGLRRVPGVSYPVLVPNLQGLEAAIEAGADQVAVFVAASETFSRKNINASISESMERVERVTARAIGEGIRVRGYLSCALGCPYEGEIPLSTVTSVAKQLADLGCYEISLGDTIGVGTPLRARAMVEAVAQQISIEQLAIHFHDTWGQALANIFACLQLGVTVVDASVAGLGGCPYAAGASGNVATEDVAYMLDGMGVESGIDLAKLATAGRRICETLGRTSASKAALEMAARG